ncbi:MAG: biopolymer transporter ExbD [Candidatus Omnitrophica bacterium]|nr:biopolymer transporter ExbD [Candidatus Omnitrophota bacterium]MDD5487944.1 biopolymer transporter ExbD [Candidatus Omnitrophota bacterium]
MMRFKRKMSIEKGRLDMAPLIDVVFLLLIFFMLTSSFIFQPGIRVNLPKAITSEVLHKELLIITITGDNKIYIRERAVNPEELYSRISVAAKEDKPLLIQADKKAPLGRVIEVWDICRQLDVKQINIATTTQ